MSDSEPEPPAAAIARLALAQAPAKQDMLGMLDKLRGEVERDEVLSLFALSIRAGDQFDMSSAGEIKATSLAGMLGRAWMEAIHAIEG